MPQKRIELIRECQPGISLLSVGLIALGAKNRNATVMNSSWIPRDFACILGTSA